MSSEKSFFTKFLGNDIGEMLQFLIGFGVMMGIFIGGPFLLSKCSSTSKDKEYKELVTGSRETTQNIFTQLHQYDSLTQEIEKTINTELLKEKEIIKKKKDLFIELQRDFDSIYLTPQQLRILETVNSDKRDVSFKEWISSTNQWYNIGVSVIISFFFYFLGKRGGKIKKTKD